MIMTVNKKRGRPRLAPETYHGNSKIRRRLNKLWIPDNPDCITVQTYPGENSDRNSEGYLFAPIECIRLAVLENKLINVAKGIWYCCMKKDDGDLSRTICVMYRMAYGNAKPLSNIMELVYKPFEYYYHITAFPELDIPEYRTKVLTVLPSNISRTFEPPNKNTLIIPYVSMHTLTRK